MGSSSPLPFCSRCLRSSSPWLSRWCRINTICMSRPLSAAPRPNSEPGSTVPLSCSSCFDTTSTVTTTDSGIYVHFGRLNTCSWNNKFDDVVALISDFDLSVLCLTETLVDQDSSVINRCRSSGFSVIDKPRSRSRDDLSVNHCGVANLPLLRRPACRCLLSLTVLLFPLLRLLPVLFLLAGVESPLL
jgi:hypothetical protein